MSYLQNNMENTEKLERTLEKVESRREETRVPAVERAIYEGFKLIEEKAYQGPTSIRYWM